MIVVKIVMASYLKFYQVIPSSKSYDMKKGKFNTGVLSVAAGVLMMMFATACNNTDDNKTKTAKGEKESADTTTATVTAKKKGRASAAIDKDEIKNAKVEKDKTGVYIKAEVMPVYEGNDQALNEYINSKIVYPEQAVENNIEGTVRVQFVVDEKGAVSDVKTVGTKLGYGLEEEAVSVVRNLPKWTPGKVGGKNVKTRLSVPITYKLES